MSKKLGMTENEAIKELTDAYSDDVFRHEEYEACRLAIKALEEIQKYRAIGTVEEYHKTMEMQRRKKPIGIDMCTCPNCNTYNKIVKKRRNTVNQDIVYCWHCGQAMEVNKNDIA